MTGEAEVQRDFSMTRFEDLPEDWEGTPSPSDYKPDATPAEEPDPDPDKGDDKPAKKAGEDDPDKDKGDEPDKGTDKDDGDETADKKPGRKRNRFQKRLDELTRERRTAESRAEELARQNRELQEKLAKVEAGGDPKPQRSDFYDDEQHEKALLEWHDRQREREAAGKKPDEAPADPEQPQLTAEQRGVLDSVYNAALDAEGRYPDFEDVVINNRDITIDYEVVKQAVESEASTDVLYYLGKHPDEAARLSALRDNPTAIARELAKVEARIEAGVIDLTPKPPAETPDKGKDDDTPPATPPSPPKATQAPPPITPPKGGGGAEPVDDSKLSDEEWYRREKARLGLVE